MFYINRNIELEKVTISKLYKMYKQNEIDDAPYYQRYSELWSPEKKRLLIDTIINGYDMPKFYFHYILSSGNKLNTTNKPYAIIDGKQRINALIEFLDGVLVLDESVKFLEKPELSFNKVTYKTIASKNEFWQIKEIIDNFQLDIIHITTDEFDRVEEMFLRLNEGVPVNNTEKRNSIGGLLIEEVNETVKELDFFTKKVKFGNKRMEHQDLLLKLCLIEHTDKLESFTKKNLDDLVKHFKPKKNAATSEKSILKSEAQILLDKVKTRLNILSQVFTEKDEMLGYKGILPLFYLFLKDNPNTNPKKFKEFIKNFDAVRNENRKIGKTQKPNTTLLQFDRLNQQGAHQAKSLETRLRIMQFYFSKGTSNFTEEMKLKDIGIETDEDTL
jgi:hypothetical protein